MELKNTADSTDAGKDGLLYTWHYQPVYTETPDKQCEYSVCEVYLDADGLLEYWTEKVNISPYGESVEELISDLQLMIQDVAKWKAIPFDSLEAGALLEQNEIPLIVASGNA